MLLSQALQGLHDHRRAGSSEVGELAHHLKSAVDHLLVGVVHAVPQVLQNTAPQVALQIGIKMSHPCDRFLGQHLYIHVSILHLASLQQI